MKQATDCCIKTTINFSSLNIQKPSSLEKTVLVQKMDTLAPHLCWVQNCFHYTVKMKTRAGSCWKPQGPPTQMTMGGNSSLKLVFSKSTPSSVCRTSARTEFLRITNKKAQCFLLSHKEGRNLRLDVSSRRRGNVCYPALVLLLLAVPTELWKAWKNFRNPLCSPSTLLGRQNSATAVHQQEHLLLLPPPTFFKHVINFTM